MSSCYVVNAIVIALKQVKRATLKRTDLYNKLFIYENTDRVCPVLKNARVFK